MLDDFIRWGEITLRPGKLYDTDEFDYQVLVRDVHIAKVSSVAFKLLGAIWAFVAFKFAASSVLIASLAATAALVSFVVSFGPYFFLRYMEDSIAFTVYKAVLERKYEKLDEKLKTEKESDKHLKFNDSQNFKKIFDSLKKVAESEAFKQNPAWDAINKCLTLCWNFALNHKKSSLALSVIAYRKTLRLNEPTHKASNCDPVEIQFSDGKMHLPKFFEKLPNTDFSTLSRKDYLITLGQAGELCLLVVPFFEDGDDNDFGTSLSEDTLVDEALSVIRTLDKTNDAELSLLTVMCRRHRVPSKFIGSQELQKFLK